MFDYRSNVVIMDIECYPNYFLVAFRDTLNPENTKHFEMRNDSSKLDVAGISQWLRSSTVITFNGNHYDMPLLMYALEGVTNAELKEASDLLIGADYIDENGKKQKRESLRSWEFMRLYELEYPSYMQHIDIFEIPTGTLSLKAYAARIGCQKLQDLPIDADKTLSLIEMDDIAKYCDNDTANTLRLYETVKAQVDLRIEISKQYKIDVRSKSDAQVGEAIFKHVIEKDRGRKIYKPEPSSIKRRFKYDIPEYIYFEHPTLQDLHDLLKHTVFEIEPSGHVKMPRELASMKIQIGKGLYTMGIGGLHSNESGQAIIAAADEIICDADVTSYYPSIIINGGYYPENCGLPFLRNYTRFRDDRAKWKKLPEKQTICNTYKIVLNGSFGKLSSIYSFLYSPKMMIQVTITGQLCLLMLIERIEKAGLRIVSANTDGIVIYGKKDDFWKAEREIHLWEIETGFNMEFTQYLAIYSQSVNSYLALKAPAKGETKLKWKRKGDYAERGLSQSGNGQVCIEAVMAYLERGIPIRETIEGCTDFLKFTNFQQVKGGAYKDGQYLGKVVRWYYSTKTDTTIVNSKGNNVPLTKGAMPAMDLPDKFPSDIDYDWYVREAYSMLDRLGVKGVPKEAQAFGLVKGGGFKWGRRDGQQTWHRIDLSTKDALCEARLKDRHDEWVYADELPADSRVCGKCKRK